MNDSSEHTWTFASLREYLLRVVSDLSQRQSQLADAQDKAVQAALVAQEKAVQAALAAADKAVAKAEENTRQWQISANEWRGAMSDRERTFVPRPEHAKDIDAMKDRLDRLESRTNVTTGIKQGSDAVIAWFFAAAGLSIGLVGIVLAILRLK